MTNLTAKNITPENTTRGDLIAFTDKRGRACVGRVAAVHPGGPDVYKVSCEGVPPGTYLAANPVHLRWGDHRTRRGDEMPGHPYAARAN